MSRTDYVVCDSPPILSLFYNRPHTDAFIQLVLEKCRELDTSLFLLKRAIPYDETGRRETEAEADRLHEDIAEWMDLHKVPYKLVESTVDGWTSILESIYNANKSRTAVLES